MLELSETSYLPFYSTNPHNLIQYLLAPTRTPPLNRAQVGKKCWSQISMALFMSDQPNLEHLKMEIIPWEVFSHQKLISVTNGWNSKKKIREEYLYKKNFDITFLRLTMVEIKQFSIIQAFTALWEIKDKEMASVSDLILNFIQMNKIEQNWDKIDPGTGNLNFGANWVWFWNRCHFLNFDISESCKSLDNRELFYLCHG